MGVGSGFRWRIWARDLLSPRSNCLHFLWNLRLQVSTPWPWGIVRSHLGGRAKDMVQTTISTDVMISATIRRLPSATRECRMPPAKHCPSYATSLTTPGPWRLQLSKSLDRELTWEHEVKWDWKCLPTWECTWERRAKLAGSVPSSTIGSGLESDSEVYFGVIWELTWECTVKQAGSAIECNSERIVKQAGNVPSSATGSILESLLGSVSQAGWKCVIECNWERPWEHGRECTWERTWWCPWERTMKCIWQFHWMQHDV